MRKTIFKNLETLKNFCIDYGGESQEFDCSLELTVDGEKFTAYSVAVCNRDLLFFTPNATLNYLIDSIGSNHYLNLFSIERG